MEATTERRDRMHTRRRRYFILWGLLTLLVLLGGVCARYYMVQRHQMRVDIALWNAVKGGDLAAVQRLIEDGADPNTSEYKVLMHQHGTTWTALWRRLLGREPQFNTETGVEGNWTQRQQWNTVLCMAIEINRPDIVRALLARGARDQDTKYLDSALMWAAERGDEEIVKMLLANRAPVNATNDFGNTALENAATGGHVRIVKLLLEHGAIDSGSLALHASERQKYPEIARLIRERLPEHAQQIKIQ